MKFTLSRQSGSETGGGEWDVTSFYKIDLRVSSGLGARCTIPRKRMYFFFSIDLSTVTEIIS